MGYSRWRLRAHHLVFPEALLPEWPLARCTVPSQLYLDDDLWRGMRER